MFPKQADSINPIKWLVPNLRFVFGPKKGKSVIHEKLLVPNLLYVYGCFPKKLTQYHSEKVAGSKIFEKVAGPQPSRQLTRVCKRARRGAGARKTRVGKIKLDYGGGGRGEELRLERRERGGRKKVCGHRP